MVTVLRSHLPAARNADPGPGTTASNRQGHPHCGPDGPCDGGQVRRPPAAVSTGKDLRPLVDALRKVVLAQRVVHTDETPVQMLAPGEKKTHRAYVWAYSTTPFSALKAVVYDFSPSRAGEHARNFLGTWNGKLVCDDFAGYKASFELGITEIGCMAHARRKFFDLHVANKSQLAEQALHSIGGL